MKILDAERNSYVRQWVEVDCQVRSRPLYSIKFTEIYISQINIISTSPPYIPIFPRSARSIPVYVVTSDIKYATCGQKFKLQLRLWIYLAALKSVYEIIIISSYIFHRTPLKWFKKKHKITTEINMAHILSIDAVSTEYKYINTLVNIKSQFK
jgi:hypothetical protein